MKKSENAAIKETLYVALFVFIISVLMEAVFLILGKWDMTVLYGNIVGYVSAVGNFFLMALTVQKAVEKEEKKAKSMMQISQSLRLMGILVIIAVFASLDIVNIISLCLPLLFPRVAVMIRQQQLNKEAKNEE